MAEVELWSYNGVKLPKLPEWAKDTYPNAYICKPSGYLHYYLTVTDKVGYCDENGWTYNAPDGVTMTHCQYVIAGSEEAVTELSETYPGISTTEWLLFENAKTGNPWSGKILWCNHDVCFEDGTVYLAASKPNEIIDLKSWLYGFCLGICGKPLPLVAKKEPTAYSYNGVRLPKLPEWDRELYPCAVIRNHNTKGMQLVLFKGTTGWGVVDGTAMIFVTDNPDEYEVTWHPFTITESGWPEIDMTTGRYYNTGSFQIAANQEAEPTWLVWSNADIVSVETGELLMAASEPIPVYE